MTQDKARKAAARARMAQTGVAIALVLVPRRTARYRVGTRQSSKHGANMATAHVPKRQIRSVITPASVAGG